MGLNLSVHVYWNTQTSTDRDIKRRWHVILGVQSAFRLAGRTNVSQTSVSKVTELMRPLQTKAFCSPVLQLKACQTIQLIDVERCQSVSCFSNQTNNNAFFCFYFMLFLHLTQEDDNKAAAVVSLPLDVLWFVLQLRRQTVLCTVICFLLTEANPEIICLVRQGAVIVFPFIWA